MSYDIVAVLSADANRFSSGFKQAENALKSFQKSTDNAVLGASKAVSGMGKALTVGLTLPLVGGFAKATQASIAFESAMVGVRKTTDLTDVEFATLTKGIMGLSRELPATQTELAGVAETAGRLGIQKEHLLSFTKTMIDLGESTDLGATTAAESLARLANITGMSQTDFDRLGSTIVTLGNNMATTESEIVQMGLRLAGAGNQVGLTEHQMMALAAAMSSVGINAEAGGSTMSRVLQKMDRAVKGSSTELQGFAKVAGMSAQEFSEAWRNDPTTALVAFVKGLDGVNKAGGDTTSILKDLGIQSILELDTMLRLAGASDELIRSLGLANQAWEENTSLATEAGLRYASTDAKIQIMKNGLREAGITIGNIVKTAMLPLIDTITKLSQAFSDMSPELQSMVVGFGMFLAMLGPIGLIAGKTTEAFISMGTAISSGISGITEGTKAMIPVVQGGLGKIKSGFETAALKAMYAGDKIAEAFPVMASKVSQGANLVTDTLKVGSEPWGWAFQDTVTKFTSTFPKLSGAFGQLGGLMQSGISGLGTIIKAGLSAIGPALLVGAIVAGLGLAYSAFGEQIDQMAQMAITKGPSIITSLGEGLATGIPNFISKGAELIALFAEVISTNVPALINAGLAIIQSIIQGLMNNMSSLISSAVTIVGALVQGLATAVPQLAVMGLQLIVSLAQGILANLPQIVQTGAEAIVNFIQGISSNIGTIVSLGIELIITLVKGLISALPSIISAGVQIILALIQGVLGGLGNLITTGLDMGKSLLNGLKSAVGFGETGREKAQKAKLGFEEVDPTDAGYLFGEKANAGAGNALDLLPSTVQDKANAGKNALAGMDFNLEGWNIGQSADAGVSQGMDSLPTTAVGAMDNVSTALGEYDLSIPGTDVAHSFTNSFTTGIGEAQAAATTSGAELGTAVASGIEQQQGAITSATNALGSGIVSALNTTKNQVNKTVSNMMSGFTTAVNTGANAVKSSFTGLSSAISSQITTMANNIRATTTSMMSGFTSVVTSGANQAKTSFTQLSTGITQQITTMANSIKATTSAMMTSFTGEITRGATTALNAIKTMASSAVSAVNGFRGQFVSAGANLSAGLASGISSGRSRVIAAAVSVMRSAVSAAKAAAAIHSPSKVMRDEVGAMLVKGLAVGLEDNAKTAISSAKNMMGKIISVYSNDSFDFNGKLSSLNGAVTKNINYRFMDSDNKEPATFIFKLGEKSFKGFVEDIKGQQDKIVHFEEVYGY